MDACKVGNNIAKFRKARNLTQQQLADVLSLSCKAISKWETGKGLPDISIVPALASALGVTIDDILLNDAVEDCPKKNERYLLPIIAAQCILLVFLFFIIFLPPSIMSLWDTVSCLLVPALAISIAFFMKTIRKAKHFSNHLIVFGFPIAGILGAASNAIISLPRYSVLAAYRIILIPIFYSAFFALLVYFLAYFLERRKKMI